jgi:hypothetical protein
MSALRSLPSRASRPVALLAACFGALHAAACRREPPPLAPFTAFVPLVVRQEAPGQIPWDTRIEVANQSGGPATVRLTRCPGDEGWVTQELEIPRGGARRVGTRIPALPCVSSLFLESLTPFSVTASVAPRRGKGPPPVAVPVLAVSDLARPGDHVLLGPILSDAQARMTFTITLPGIETASLPFRLRLVFRDGSGAELRRLDESLWGLPMLVEHPWEKYALPPGVPFHLDVEFLSARRPPRAGLWVYGIVRERGTGTSRLIPGTVVRAPASNGASPAR